MNSDVYVIEETGIWRKVYVAIERRNIEWSSWKQIERARSIEIMTFILDFKVNSLFVSDEQWHEIYVIGHDVSFSFASLESFEELHQG